MVSNNLDLYFLFMKILESLAISGHFIYTQIFKTLIINKTLVMSKSFYIYNANFISRIIGMSIFLQPTYSGASRIILLQFPSSASVPKFINIFLDD